jgi:uncharacterized protein YkwD
MSSNPKGEEVVTEVVEEEYTDNNGVKHRVKKTITTRKVTTTRQIRDGEPFPTTGSPEGSRRQSTSSSSSSEEGKKQGITSKLKKLLTGSDKDGASSGKGSSSDGTASVSAPASASTSSPPSESDIEFEKEALKWHNIYRERHGVPPLKLNPKLLAFAREWAQKLANEDCMKHRPSNEYGENIFMKWSSDPSYVVSGKDPVESWYSEIKVHNFSREPTSLDSGHFTQVVWKKSRELGMGRAKSKTGKYIVVANYDPAGNFVGNFVENVPLAK